LTLFTDEKRRGFKMIQNKKFLLVVPVLGFLILLAFQNCSQVNFSAMDVTPVSTLSSVVSPPPVDHSSYAWVGGGWSLCSASCGQQGAQTQTVVCQRNDGVAVAGSFCGGTPPSGSQSCSGVACIGYSWVASGFGNCSASCGGGTQTQSVLCKDNAGNSSDASLCSGSRPATSQTCNTQACKTYSWTSSPWGSCSADCGGGTQGRLVKCTDNDGQPVDDSFCAAAKPPSTQSCNINACATYNWVQGGFGSCSLNCGGGTQTQAVTCKDNSGNIADNSKCAANSMPATSIACNTQACPTYSWSQSGWGVCSVACGGGMQNQTVTCKDQNGNSANSSLCTAAQPPASQSCNSQACPLQPLNGLCGSANGAVLPAAPQAGLCNQGIASASPSCNGSGKWTWTCSGANGGTSASCSASLNVNSCSAYNYATQGCSPGQNVCNANFGTTNSTACCASTDFNGPQAVGQFFNGTAGSCGDGAYVTYRASHTYASALGNVANLNSCDCSAVTTVASQYQYTTVMGIFAETCHAPFSFPTFQTQDPSGRIDAIVGIPWNMAP
jgi:hypothetical protein